MKNYNLFLDDVRKPEHAYIYPKRNGAGLIIETQSLKHVSNVDNDNWIVVRNYDDFVKTIEEKGLPDVVSFDHDLHEEHIKHYYSVTEKTGIVEYGNLKIKTGKHCAEYFVQKYKELCPTYIPHVYVHSANQWGAQEIRKVLKEIC
jgi:ASC-1-like (ASCH) protein